MHNEKIVQQNLQRKLRAHPGQAMARKATSPPVLFDIGKHDFDRLTPQAVHRLGLGSLHPGPVGYDQVFMLATLHTAAALFARCTALTQGTSLTGLNLAAIGPLHNLTSPTAHALVTPAPLEELAGRARRGIEVAMPRKLILAKERGGLGPAPVIFFPRSIERHALRRALGQVH